jgi:hypothetical protein
LQLVRAFAQAVKDADALSGGGDGLHRRGLPLEKHPDLRAWDGGGVGIDHFDLEVGGEARSHEKSREKKGWNGAHCTPPLHAKGVMDGDSRRSPGLASEDVGPITTAGLPGPEPSGRRRISSLTVARQRGICTRFPVPVQSGRNARTKDVKERKDQETEIYL